MRESRTYGSVRGAGSNLRPYRDRLGGCSNSSTPMRAALQEFRIEEDFYAAADARLPSDEASASEREHPLVN